MIRATKFGHRREFTNNRAIGAIRFAAFGLLYLFIANAAPAQTANFGPDVVPKAREFVAKFVDEFSTIRYEEDLSQQKLRDNGKIEYKQEIVYDSITRIRFDEQGKLRVDEQRIIQKHPLHVEKRSLLATYGFSSMAMIFHPYYSSSFHFTRLEDDTLHEKSLTRIGFEHVPGAPSPLLYQMVGAEKPMELTGTAWIDPSTGEIHRIEAVIAFPPKDMDMKVKTIRADLLYGSVVLQDEKTSRMLPVSATIDLETPRQHWRNVHSYVDYRKYRVTTNFGVANP